MYRFTVGIKSDSEKKDPLCFTVIIPLVLEEPVITNDGYRWSLKMSQKGARAETSKCISLYIRYPIVLLSHLEIKWMKKTAASS